MKTHLIAIIILAPWLSGKSSNALPQNPGTPTAQVVNQTVKPYFAALVVTNIDNSIDWYKDIFGLELRNRVDSPERGFRQANLYSEFMLIELVELKSMLTPEEVLKDKTKGTELTGYYKMGFIVDDLEEWHSHLEKKQVRFEGRVVTDSQTGEKTFLINDPDNNLIQFFEQ